MFFAMVSGRTRKQQTRKLNELAAETRSIIRTKLNEMEKVDEQLKKVVSETRELTSSIREKLATQLKITRKTLKSVCYNLHDGVIIVNHVGKIIDMNPASERIIGYSQDDILGHDFNFLTRMVNAKKESGGDFELGDRFFDDLSHTIFYHLSCIEDDSPKKTLETYKIEESQSEVKIKVADTERKVSLSVFALDNDPTKLDEITYLVFLRPVHELA